MRISDWSSDVCSSDLAFGHLLARNFAAIDAERGRDRFDHARRFGVGNGRARARLVAIIAGARFLSQPAGLDAGIGGMEFGAAALAVSMADIAPGHVVDRKSVV